jgi:hypothetical protein
LQNQNELAEPGLNRENFSKKFINYAEIETPPTVYLSRLLLLLFIIERSVEPWKVFFTKSTVLNIIKTH